MTNKVQQLKGKTKLKMSKNISNYHDKMDIRMDEHAFSKNAQGISKLCHELLLLIKFAQTKPQVKNMNTKKYDLYYTVIKNIERKKKLWIINMKMTIKILRILFLNTTSEEKN